MNRVMSVSDNVLIKASSHKLYDLISDPTQMGRWSPENRGAIMRRPGEPVSVGTVFVGRNRRGPFRWVTECVVTAAQPGQLFAFDVRMIGPRTPRLHVRIASWSYQFAAVADGTVVTEIWTDGRSRWPDWATAVFDPVATRHRSFADFQRGNIRRTLDRLKATVEADSTQPGSVTTIGG